MKKIPIVWLAFLLAGCALSPSQQAGQADGASQSVAGSEDSQPQCGTMSGSQALAASISRVPPAGSGTSYRWDPTVSDVTGYDPCVALSWIVLRIAGATVSSPEQILFFSYGEYVGRATQQAFGFSPTIERLGPTAVKVTFKWARDDESNAMASGRSESVYVLSEATNKLEHTGELPPGIDLASEEQ